MCRDSRSHPLPVTKIGYFHIENVYTEVGNITKSFYKLKVCLLIDITVWLCTFSRVCPLSWNISHSALIQSTLGSIIKHAVSFQACPKCYAIADIKMDTFDISSLFDYHGNQQIQTSPKTTTGWWRQMCKPRLAELLSRWVWSATLEKAEPGVVIYRFVLSLDHHCLLPLHALITPTVFIRIVTLPIIHHRRWGEWDRR